MKTTSLKVAMLNVPKCIAKREAQPLHQQRQRAANRNANA